MKGKILAVFVGLACFAILNASAHGSHDFDHEHDHEEDWNESFGMPAEEVQVRMRTIFGLMDTDGNGKVSRDEMTRWIDHMKGKVKVRNVKLEFENIDSNDDGKISFEELKAAQHDGEDSYEAADLLSRFKIADRDHDDFLNHEELELILHPEQDAELLAIEVSQILDAQDSDGDRKISFDEFRGSDTESIDEAEMKSLRSDFDEYDRDKDGFIGSDEIAMIIKEHGSSGGEKSSPEIVVDLIGNEPEVSLQDAVEHFSVFAKTKLTDMGDAIRFPEDYDIPVYIHEDKEYGSHPDL